MSKAQHNHVDILLRALEQSPVAMVITDADARIEYVNPAFSAITGYEKTEVIGKKTSLLKSGHQRIQVYTDLWKTLILGQKWRGEFHNRRKDGLTYWESAMIVPVRNQKGKIQHYFKIAEDITRRKQLESDLKQSYQLLATQAQALRETNDRLEQTARALRSSERKLRRIACQDALTGLLNRHGFKQALDNTLALVQRQAGAMGLLVIDIDHFKQINDRFGHDAGDRLLKACARQFRQGLRRADLICRHGGDEFVVALPMSTPANTLAAADRLLKAVRSTTLKVKSQSCEVTLSIGAACSHPPDAPDIVQLMCKADQALYRAKHAGRNQVCLSK